METKNRRELVTDILRENKSGIHVRAMAQELISRGAELNITEDDLMAKISNTLSTDIRKNKSKSIFQKIPNKKGGYKQGFYKLKPIRKSVVDTAIENIVVGTKIEIPSISNLYTGKAGEYAVLSELLFNEFNASLMSVDQGIDIVASKDTNFFHIQVKTANGRSGGFYASINKNQFVRFNNSNTYYIFVIRYYLNAAMKSDFIILRSFDIEKYVQTGVIKSAVNLGLTFKISKTKILLNTKEDVSFNFNNFDLIKS